MKSVPFIPNSPDDMHCVNAVFRMVHQYYFGEDISWEEIDRITKTIPGKGTWTFIGEMEFAKKGLTVTNIEPIDYMVLHKEGPAYLRRVLGDQTTNYYLKNSNLTDVLSYIPEYLTHVQHQTRKATIEEIIEHLHAGDLVGVEVNSALLNNTKGFTLHFVLLYDVSGNDIIMHDPGYPPRKARKVSITRFQESYDFPGANGSVTIFSKKKSSH